MGANPPHASCGGESAWSFEDPSAAAKVVVKFRKDHADGTWNDPQDEHPTNVLRVARAISPLAADGCQQVVFVFTFTKVQVFWELFPAF